MEKATRFFEVRVNSIPPTLPLACDLFLMVNAKPVLFRKRGDSITSERLSLLAQHGGQYFLIPEDQRTLYHESLNQVISDPKSSTETKCKFIKETAYVHLHDLFTKEDVAPIVSEARSLVEKMVKLVTTDVQAVSNLLRLSAHDYYTYNHCVDVSIYCVALGKRIYGDDPELLLKAGLAGLLHDIGKRKIDWNIINKATPLTADEWKQIRQHPVYGEETLEFATSLPDESKRAVAEHHENWDGSGYPNGLGGDGISALARIVTIADVFDALTTTRSYHKAVPASQALDIMFSMQPGKFDPQIFQSFNKNFDKKTDLRLGKQFDPCQPEARTQLEKK